MRALFLVWIFQPLQARRKRSEVPRRPNPEGVSSVSQRESQAGVLWTEAVDDNLEWERRLLVKEGTSVLTYSR